MYISCLQDHVDDDDKERIGEVIQEPDFNRFDDWSAGETVGHGQVDRGQHHHAGSNKIPVKGERKTKFLSCLHIHCKDNLISIFYCDKISRLVDNIYQYCWQICHHKDAIREGL